MKRVLLSMTSALALAVTVQSALAADRPLPPPRTQAPLYAPARVYDWSGFYVGINGGGGWGNSNYDFVGAGLGSTDIGVSGALVGGTIGANYQAGAAVFGIEGDLDWSNIRGSAACPVGTCETRNHWLSTVRGRLGYAADRFMPYVTGGVAFGGVRANVPGVGAASDTRTGWTVGGGIEYAMLNNWSAKLEYLYVDLCRFDCGGACGVAPPTNVDLRTHVARVGLNYKF
jgi:outer membrane immunogenic protein